MQVARIEVVVLDRISGPRDVSLLEAVDAAHELELHVVGQAGRNSVGVDLVRGEPFGLHENLMRALIGEAVDLVLDRRAVAWADPLDLPGEHRRAVTAAANDVVSTLVCFRNETRNLFWMVFDSPEKRKDRHRVIRVLGLHHAEVDGAAVDPRRRTGFQAPDSQR